MTTDLGPQRRPASVRQIRAQQLATMNELEHAKQDETPRKLIEPSEITRIKRLCLERMLQK